MNIGWFGIGSGALSDAAGVGEIAQAAEALGYESVWIGEHPVLIDPQAAPSPLPPDTPMLDPVPSLAFAAARTERIKLGTGIVLLPMRHPLLLAKELASVDVLSGGRLLVGVGVGYVPGEFAAIGVDFHTRGRRADECIDALRSMWRDDHPAYAGEHVQFAGVQSYPRPHQPGGPPIIASGRSTPAYRRAVARADGWYGFFHDVDATKVALQELADLAAVVERGEGLGRLEITITPPGPVTRDDARRFEDLGVDRLVLFGQWSDVGGQPEPARRAANLTALEHTARELALS